MRDIEAQYQLYLPLIRQLAGWSEADLAKLIGSTFTEDTIKSVECRKTPLTYYKFNRLKAAIRAKICEAPARFKELSDLVEALDTLNQPAITPCITGTEKAGQEQNRDRPKDPTDQIGVNTPERTGKNPDKEIPLVSMLG